MLFVAFGLVKYVWKPLCFAQQWKHTVYGSQEYTVSSTAVMGSDDHNTNMMFK